MRKTFLFILALCAASAVWGTPVTVTKTAKEIGTAAKWSKSTAYATAKLDDVITITVTQGTEANKNGVYYTGDYTDTHDWRMYQARAEGQFAITAAEGYVITSVTLTYAVTNTGVVSTAVKETGVATPDANQILSGTAYPFANSELTFYVGNTTAATTNGQARIRSFSVTYEKGIVETFDKLADETKSSTSDRTGDWYTWKITTGARHKTTDVLYNGTRSLWLAKEGAMETTTAIEGGVKYVSFLWNKFDKNASSITVNVTAGGVTRTLTKEVQTGDDYNQNHPDLVFGDNFGVKSNTKLKIANPQNTTALQIGPITIVPYLRYTYTEMQEVKIGEGTFDCSLQIDNTDGGTITYSSDNTDVVSFASESSPIATLNGGGEATITATWSEASTSFKLKVIAKSTPEISFENEEVTITDLYTTEPVENKLTVTEGAGAVTYTSSNTLVAVIKDSKVEVVGVGTATITATTAENEDYVSASASYTLTVNEPEGEAAVSEDFDGKLPLATSYQTEPVNFTDQDGLYAWTVNGHKYDGTWVRFATNANACMTSQGIQEGGVKRLAFTWKRANGECAKIHTTIKALDKDGNEIVDRSIELAGSEDQTSNQTYNMRFDEVKQNAQFYLRNEGDGFVTLISDIKIVPYVLYTEKAQTANAEDETYDATTGLINNAPAGEVTFSIVTEGAQATIDEATGEVDMTNVTTSEDIVIKASYGDAYTTMNLHVNALPVPTVSFADGDAVEKDMNTVGYVNTLTKDGDGEVTYSSSDETVAEVDVEGVITITGEGVTTITAKVAACQTYTTAEASYELTITDPEDDAITETFERNDAGSSTADREGTYYTWKITTGARTRATDKLFNETPSIWLAGDNAASISTTIEGGVKRVGFLWNKFNKDASSVTISVKAGGVERTLTKEVQTGVNQNNPDLEFNSNFGVKSNTTLTISKEKLDASTALQVGPIKITPYLLYTKKTDSKMLVEDGENIYINTELINNTGQELSAITFTTDNSEIAVMKENPAYPGTLKLVGGIGDVTVTAKWVPDATKQDEFVTTSYVLHVTNKEYSDAEFTTEGKVEHVLADGTFTNAVTFTKGEGPVSYSSDNEAVATVNTTGLVTIHRIGTAIISGHMDETDNYHAWDGSYTLVVHTGIADDQKLVEHFTQMPKGLISTEGGDEVEGDIDITWLAYSTRRGTNDTIGGTGVQGNNIFATGYIDSKTPIEGGVKYFSFNWKQWAKEQGATLKLVATINDAEYPMEYEVTDPSGATTNEHFFFGQNVFAKKNVAIKLENKSYNTQSGEPLASNGRITFDAFEIVPYLYYKTKEVKFDVADGEIPTTYTNGDLINNIDEGPVSYAITDENGIASNFNTSTGEITFDEDKQGTATITASWEDVTTSYTITVVRKQDLTVWFENATEKVTIGQSYTLQEMQLSAASDGDKSYTSSDNTVAEVEDGVLTIKKVGTVTITGTVDETTTYKSGSASYVLAILPNETDVISETYNNILDAGVTHERTDYKGDYDLTWYYRNGRSKSTDKMVSGDKAFWFCHVVTDNTKKYKSSYIETTFEGGIKAVYFDWKSASVSNNNNLIKMEIKADGEKVDEISVIGTQSHIDYDQPYSFSMEQKKSVKLTIANVCRDAANENDIEGKLALGPITIVPYLFYTTKSADLEIPANVESATYKNTALIDNRDDDEAISYSVSEGASVNNEGTVTVSAAGEYIVTATWGEVSTSFTLKVTAKEPDFTLENKTAGAFATICLPKKIASVENATLWSINYGDKTAIEFVVANLTEDAAGMPYLVQVEEDGDVKFFYVDSEEEEVTEPVDVVTAKGFVGSLQEAEQTIPSDGTAILVSGGQLHIAGEWCVLTQNRAYIDSNNLPASAPVGGAPRRTVRLYNPDAAPTNLDGLNGAVKPMKVLRDGQFYILRDTKIYNAQGNLVE